MKKVFVLFVISVLSISCKDDTTSVNSNTDGFDRRPMLTNWADNIIIPSYENYVAKTNALQASTTEFSKNPTSQNLSEVKNAWKEAYKAYQTVALFDLDKAQEIRFIDFTNTYPTNTQKIAENIAASTYDLTLLSQIAAQGYPAMDYMLYGLGESESDVLSFYTTHTIADKYKKYITDLSARTVTLSNQLVTYWKNDYRDAFVSSTGSAVSSSTNKMLNTFVQHYEFHVRGLKIGGPSGRLNNGNKVPERVEAFYEKDFSKELALTAIKAGEDFFNGKKFNDSSTGESILTYINFLKVERDGQLLGNLITAQYQSIYTKTASVSDSFYDQVKTDNTKMLDLFDVLQRNVIYFKINLLPALSINIDYADNDGD